MTTDGRPADEDYNGWADFWRSLGPNVFPWNKGPGREDRIDWKGYQTKQVPQSVHDDWKKTDAFKDGIAVMAGVCWNKKPFDPRLRLFGADGDEQSKIDLICTSINGKPITLQELSKVFLVERYEDEKGLPRAHLFGYYLSDTPYPKVNSPFELKCDGAHGIMRCTNSLRYYEDDKGNFIHNGQRFDIIAEGTLMPTVNNQYLQHLISIGNGNGKTTVNQSNFTPTLATTIWQSGDIIEVGERHNKLLPLISSLLIKHPDVDREIIFEWVRIINIKRCRVPLPEPELREMFNSCQSFALPFALNALEKKVTLGRPLTSLSLGPLNEKQRDKAEDNKKASKIKIKLPTSTEEEPPEEAGIAFEKDTVKGLSNLFLKHELDQNLLEKIFSFFHKCEVSLASCFQIVDIMTKDEEEKRYRRDRLIQIFDDDPNLDSAIRNITSKEILNALITFFNSKQSESKTKIKHQSKKVFTLIIRCLILVGDPILWLTDIIMRENVLATMDDNDEIYYYKDGLFIKGGATLIKKQIELLFRNITSQKVNEVINHIRRATYTSRSNFDNNIDMLNMDNCVLNIHTLETKPHSPDYLFLSKIPTVYNPEAKCPLIDNFFRQVLKPEDIPIVHQIIGYCLYKTWKYQKAFMLFGRSGSNGKGVSLNIIAALLDRSNCSYKSLQDLDNNRFATAGLYGKYANLYGDLKATKLLETGNFKVIVAGDELSAENKHAPPFSFRNYAKLIFSANLLPESHDKTDAFYRRWVIINFEKRFADGKEDAKLTEKLTTPEELSGLLNLALLGLKDLTKNGGFHQRTIEEVKREYEENTSDVNAFLIHECVVDTQSEYMTLTTDLYAAYVNFCKSRHALPFEIDVFGRELAKHGLYNSQHRTDGTNERYYDGVILRSSLREPGQTGIQD